MFYVKFENRCRKYLADLKYILLGNSNNGINLNWKGSSQEKAKYNHLKINFAFRKFNPNSFLTLY